MDVFPQDLGSRWHVTLVCARTPARHRRGPGLLRGDAAVPVEDKAAERATLGPLGRFWTRGANLDPETAAAGLSGMRTRTLPITLGMGLGALAYAVPMVAMAVAGEPVGAAVFAGATTLMGSLGLFLPRFLFRRVHARPLAANEIEALLGTTSDLLDRAYLTLVADVIRQPEAMIPNEARSALRDALTALAEAIEQLPPAYVPSGATAQSSPDDLRAEAERVRAEAEREPDVVSAASLARQGDALLRQADAQERSATLLRRASVLRNEMIAQTKALRAGLAGFHAGQAEVSGLADLADVARRVAGEATNVARARDELDAVAVAAPAVAVPQQVGRS